MVLPTPGDYIEIKIKDKVLKGIYIESPNPKIITLKLDSGYNLGISKGKIEKIKVKKKPRKNKLKKITIKPKKGLKTVSILHTGGTIASKVDYTTGAVTSRFKPEEIISMFPEIQEITNIQSKLIRNMASDDMRFAHFNIIAKEIEKEIKSGVDGIIVTQGTDNLHYTAAALSFILECLPIPVLVVGAQRSSDRGSSDAAMNLISACKFIAETDFAEVATCMHKNTDDDICSIIPGTKVRKMHTSRRDAFKAINIEPWAEVDFRKLKVIKMRDGYCKRENKKLKLKLIKENLKIGLAVAHPNMFVKELEVYESFDGLILQGTGLGHFPISKIDEFTLEHKRILNKIKKLAKKIPIVMSPQTIFGRIDMNVYSPGRTIQEAGVIGNYSDMTPETAFIKLAWLLSNHKGKVKEMMDKNLRGEISSRTSAKGFLDD